MATMVGNQKDLTKLLNALTELDFDAIEAYRVAIDKLENVGDRGQLGSFMADHQRHVTELQRLVIEYGERPAVDSDAKAILTKGKVYLGGIFGDRAILLAMKTNEDDTNTAYERAAARDDLPSHVRAVITKNLGDERRHRAYIQSRLDTFEHTPARR
jgi:uncharacterized protein (TIGR02284 family)